MKLPLSIIVQLVHIHGPMKGEIQEFTSNDIHIGRHPSCDLQFPKDLVAISRKHAHIIREGNRFKIIDTSTNGTFVNGKKISEAWLKNGDVLFFTEGGPKISFLTREGESGQAAAPSLPARPQREPVPVLPKEKPPLSIPPVQPLQPAVRTESEPLVETIRAPLVIQYGPILKSFTELPITIGTQADCDLILEHPCLSGKHAQIFFSQGSYRIKDLTGRDQVMINSRRMTSPSSLGPGDQVFLTESGPAFQFMEGGRMAEIPVQQPNQSVPVPENETRPETDPPEKKSYSLFKKIFR